jgi:hypothetical protein
MGCPFRIDGAHRDALISGNRQARLRRTGNSWGLEYHTPLSAPTPDLTWPALLAKWTQFAQASAAFPRTGMGDRWRASVPAIIGLQAVTFALADLAMLLPNERVVGLARAAAVIERHRGELLALWGLQMSPELRDLIADAQAALVAAKTQKENDPA